METRRLGDSDLDLTIVGLGTWVFGGRWGGAEDADSLAACHAAVDAGINWIDTADVYGQHRAERIVGRFLKERSEDVIVATKCGVAWETDPAFRIWRDASGDYIRSAVDRNLGPSASTPSISSRCTGPSPTRRPRDHGRHAGPAEGGRSATSASATTRRRSEAAWDVTPFVGFRWGTTSCAGRSRVGTAWCADHGVGVSRTDLSRRLLTGRWTPRRPSRRTTARRERFFTDEAWPERVGDAGLARIAEEGGRPGGVAELCHVGAAAAG